MATTQRNPWAMPWASAAAQHSRRKSILWAAVALDCSNLLVLNLAQDWAYAALDESKRALEIEGVLL